MEAMKTSSHRVIKHSAYLLPNLMTTFNLICGLLAILLCLETLADQDGGGHQFYAASAWLILASMVFDFLDGKVARWVDAVSEFGMKIDSLTDFLSFGIAPLVLIYSVFLQPVPVYFSAVACGLFLFGGAWRLARFNCETDTGAQANSFSGLPIPAAAAFLCSLVLIFPSPEKMVPRFLGRSFSTFPPAVNGILTSLVLLGLGFLMISRIPFPAFKKVDRRNLILFGGIAIFGAVLLTVLPLQNIVFLIMLIYLLFGLFQHFVERVIKLQGREIEKN
jgi:CDP-diacylglycerol---serine O-phosphatidyltransferase